jgi:hypothetical protein
MKFSFKNRFFSSNKIWDERPQYSMFAKIIFCANKEENFTRNIFNTFFTVYIKMTLKKNENK